MTNKGDILADILKKFKECYIFLHNTKEFSIVENIMNEGFIFENQLAHSTDRVNPNDSVELTYFFFQRKDYGTYTIVIAIPKTIYDHYTAVSNREKVDIEDVLSITVPFYGENDELVYTLSPKHILGYLNIKSSEFFQNRNWDPFFNNTLSGSPKNIFSKHVKKK